MKDDREKDVIEIEFNQEGLDRYLEYYFKLNPKKRKTYIEQPMVRSLNKMLVITNRVVQNTYKQAYKDYTQFVVKEHGLEMLGISSADLEVQLTFPTKIRHDLDNFTIKEVADGFTEVGLIVDDSYEYIRSIKTTAKYEKGVTKMVFTFKNCKYDKEALKAAMEKEKNKREKREASIKENKAKKKTKNNK